MTPNSERVKGFTWVVSGTFEAARQKVCEHRLEPGYYKILCGPDSGCGYSVKDHERVLFTWDCFRSPAMGNESIRQRFAALRETRDE
jgi:hypothetical protein